MIDTHHPPQYRGLRFAGTASSDKKFVKIEAERLRIGLLSRLLSEHQRSHWQVIEKLNQDDRTVLYRANIPEQDSGHLIVVPTTPQMCTEVISRSTHEMALLAWLDPTFAVIPNALLHSSGAAALVLDDCCGTPLKLEPGSPMDIKRFLNVALALTAAVQKMHARGLVHKDIRPANFLLDMLNTAKITGFGSAALVTQETSVAPCAIDVGSTLAYMAPEQTGRMNRVVDERSDLYSLGVTLYQMLTGSLPFSATEPMEWVHCHVARSPIPAAERVEGVPSQLSVMVQKLLSKTAEDRYQSAAGLHADLMQCVSQWQRSRSIMLFAMESQPLPERILNSRTLHGRSDPIGQLVAAYGRVHSRGQAELVLVGGISGVGKSSVVDTLRKQVLPTQGFFAAGKFEQHRNDIPYATLTQALSGLIDDVLCLAPDAVGAWKARLSTALGSNGQLVVNLVPKLELVIGPQVAVADASPVETAMRLQLAVRNFIGAFGTQDKPVVLFIDDLQWLDAATLELLQQLIAHDEVRNLLLLGAYRDNEVEATHPLRRMIKTVRQAAVPVTEITLEPLGPDDVRALVAEMLREAPSRVASLAALIHEKTRGNPFFAIQFTSALVEQGMLCFDRNADGWQWDLSYIRAHGYSENVADLMLDKLTRLTGNARKVLEMLTCIGSGASTRTLHLVSTLSAAEVESGLYSAQQAGLIVRNGDTCRFLHDRIQEAAYASIDPVLRPRFHLCIARKLAATSPLDGPDFNIFDVANQYTRGMPLITDPGERNSVAELYLQAGQRAKGDAAHAAALSYFRCARSMLPKNSWTDAYGLTFSVESALAECEFLTGDLVEAQSRLTDLAARATGLSDRAVVAWQLVTLFTALDQCDRAIEICLSFLATAGIDWSSCPDKDEARQEYDLLFQQMGSSPIESLLTLPPLSDPERRAVLDVLTAVLPPAFFTNQNLVCLVLCRMANLSLRHGNSDGSALAYAYLGMVVGPYFGDFRVAYRFGKLGFDLVEQGQQNRYKARVYMCFAYHVLPWTRPIHSGLDLLRQAFFIARDNGDLTYAGFSSCTLVTTLLSSGEHLSNVQSEGRSRLKYVKGAKFGLVVDIITAQLQLVATLQGETPVFGSFDDEVFNEADFEQHLAENRSLDIAACWYWIRKAQARFLAGDVPAALAAMRCAKPLLWTSSGHLEMAQYHFCGALIRAAACGENANAEEQALHRMEIDVHLAQLKVWAAHCPVTFDTRVALIEAEIARLEGSHPEAMRFYEVAIQGAREGGFVHNEALALELSAGFHAGLGMHAVADALLRQACHCYSRWGADGKVQQLERMQDGLLQRQPPSHGDSASASRQLASMDVAALLRTSHAMSSEVGLENLMHSLMLIALEHAGAQRGLLLLPMGDQLRIEAEATTQSNAVVVKLRASEVQSTDLPLSVMHYAMRTRTLVLLDDAQVSGNFTVDRYIVEHRSRSILCLPLLKQAEVIGLLYLENDLTPKVFTPSRVAMLTLLASTAAISLENASLEEKESLLQEVHHRVKNNLQLISSLLSLQASRVSDPAVAELFADSRNRVRSMALVHENLYRAGNFARVPMPAHIQTLCSQLVRAYGMEARKIEMSVRIDDLQLDLNRAVSCGLIVNELVSNALKHGFPDDRCGRIDVELRVDTLGQCALRISDDGIGLPVNLDPAQADSLGAPIGRRPDSATVWSTRSGARQRRNVHDPFRGECPRGDAPMSSSRILVVEDDRVVARDIKQQLTRMGYDVVGVTALGEQACALAIETQADLVLMDIRLEGTIDGIEAAQRIRQTCQIPVVFLTAYADDETLKRAKLTEPFGYLLKPFEDSQLRTVVEMGLYKHAAEHKLRDSERKYAATLASIGDAVIATDEQYGVSYMNQVAETLTGWSMDEAKGLPLDQVFRIIDEDTREAVVGTADRVLQFGHLTGMTHRSVLLAKDGVEWPIDESISPIIDDRGKVDGVVLVFRELTERLAIEKALRDAQADLAQMARFTTMGELAASIAHEINQPLSAIVTNAGAGLNFLRRDAPDIDETREVLQCILSDGTRAAGVIRGLQTLARKARPHLVAMDIHQTIREVLTLIRTEMKRRSVRLLPEAFPGARWVLGDRILVQQVLLNLINNAIESMDTVEVGSRWIRLSIPDSAPRDVAIAVADNGCGLPPNMDDRIFEPFYSTKPQGMGMGLSICRSIIEAHEGRLWVTPSREGQGTEFIFSLPAANPTPPAP